MASLIGWGKEFLGLDKYGNMSGTERQFAMQEEIAKNQMQWNIQGMKQAGVNPILAVNGGAHSASTAMNESSTTGSQALNALTSVAKVAIALAAKNPKALKHMGFGR